MKAWYASVLSALVLPALVGASGKPGPGADPAADARVGQAADISPSAYQYRADRRAEENPPESWVLLAQHAGLPFDQKVDARAPAFRGVLAGLLWEEVRPVRRLELSWPEGTQKRPGPERLVVTYFDSADGNAHTWWNPRTVRQAGPATVSADGRTYSYAVATDTWGVVVGLCGGEEADKWTPPRIRALVPHVWKKAVVEIEWGYEDNRAVLAYDGQVEVYDGLVSEVRPLAGDDGTKVTGTASWQSRGRGPARRGVRLSLLYMGDSGWRRTWPYHSPREDVARTIVTVRTGSGSFSFLAADLEHGPILAPEYGFFVRAVTREAAREAENGGLSGGENAGELLRDRQEEIPGVPRVRGWSRQGMPWFGVNPTDAAGVSGSLTIPPRCTAMHPAPDRDVAAGWRSPIQGRVRVRARVAMGDARGGNGIAWGIVREGKPGRQVLANGTIGTGGSRAIPAEQEAEALAAVPVGEGDYLALVVTASGEHVCDTTIVELRITEVGGQGREWDLGRDVRENIHAGNPHPDSLGHAGVWHFTSREAALSAVPAPSQPPFPRESAATSARDFQKELAAKGLATVRQRVRSHPEQTWQGAVSALRPGQELPPHPRPEFEPVMKVSVPDERLNAQWKLGAWHILRRSVKGADGTWAFNDYPFGILASETYMILRALDLQGFPREAADGLSQWLRLPEQPRVVPGQGGHHGWALADRPLGHFADGQGCLTHAEGPPGAGGHMDGVHAMGPGAIMLTLTEHFRLTGDREWLKKHAPRMVANARWILRQRQALDRNFPGGERLWSHGLQPPHVVTPDSERMYMSFYESEAYYWLAVAGLARVLKESDPKEAAGLAAEAEAYRKDILAAVNCSLTLTPVVPVRDGTYRSFLPFAPYVRGFASGAWGWRRCQGHVGALYWDTVQSALPLISPAGLLETSDPRVQGYLDVLEDRLLLENSKLADRTPGYDPARHWFAHAGWQYQCGLERQANVHLEADDVPNALRSVLNQYAVDIMPGEYTFREHTTGGPPDKIFEEACFLERFRDLLVMEAGDDLWLARGTPRAWLAQGQKVAVAGAPTHFGTAGYEITSDVDNGAIRATVDVPERNPPRSVLLRLRHPRAAPIKAVTVNGKPWGQFDRERDVVRLEGLRGKVAVAVQY